MRIAVFGAGYLGITHAVCMSHLGHEVVAVDTDAARVAELSAGLLPISEPGLADLLAANSVEWTDDPQRARDCDLYFVCVGTPSTDGPSAQARLDVSAVVAAVGTIATLAPHPVGTSIRLLQQFPQIRLLWNPEFLREGHAVADTLHPDRIVIGGADPQPLLRVYEGINAPVITTDLATAELAKSAANAFLATKLSFINGLSELASATGADIGTITRAMGLDPRIGSQYLSAGLGYGGGCLPKDVRGLAASARDYQASHFAELLSIIDATNLRQRERTCELVANLCTPGARIDVWGATFKEGSDDVRDSPGLAVAHALKTAGFRVRVVDPLVGHWPPELQEPEAIVVATAWSEFSRVVPEPRLAHGCGGVVVDARGVLERSAWVAAGWTYRNL
ncbi:UDP-glucose/GDP-mannose dehydrogenase family protein [Corynebacterium diphtheriae]|nr:UDP-glucose/GDP-mannose dehydrogenase family protein [Corynebacterium diphtheriae]CAB0715342.1 UDP-glucose/GDP-mannose dehydrogenase family protein [Corynebacterium diphtheriae]CAB0715457.1 UDP-glucose/GDP-mannose dehydrogenase family protein [Corynebacterium diphtheriae]